MLAHKAAAPAAAPKRLSPVFYTFSAHSTPFLQPLVMSAGFFFEVG